MVFLYNIIIIIGVTMAQMVEWILYLSEGWWCESWHLPAAFQIRLNGRFKIKKNFPVTVFILTMSRCSRLALLSSSSLTISMCPSLAAEINAVQQSCTHRQPVTLGTPIWLRIQVDKRLSELYVGRAGKFSKHFTYQLVIPGAHGNAVSHGRTGVSDNYVWKTRVTTVSKAFPFFLCVTARVSTFEYAMCNSRLDVREILMRGVLCEHACVCLSRRLYACVSVCVCVCVREREREGGVAPEGTGCWPARGSCHLVRRAMAKSVISCHYGLWWFIIAVN